MFHDSGSRFTHLMEFVAAMSGGRKIGFSNPVFLAQKEKFLKTLAVSHYMKGVGCYTEHTDPTDNANLLFQAGSIEMNCQKLAVVAATMAKIGVCPTTHERVLDRGALMCCFDSRLTALAGRYYAQRAVHDVHLRPQSILREMGFHSRNPSHKWHEWCANGCGA